MTKRLDTYLAILLRHHKQTQKEIAAHLGIHESRLSQISRRLDRKPTPIEMMKLCKFFEMDESTLFHNPFKEDYPEIRKHDMNDLAAKAFAYIQNNKRRRKKKKEKKS